MMNTETKVSLEDALEMSLDDYINKTGIVNPNIRPRKDIKKLMEIPIYQNDDVDMMEEEMPHDHSAQWRLYPPNNSPNRPSGMPPLIPIAASLTQKSVNRQKRGGSNNSKKWKFDDQKFTKDCEFEEQRRLNNNGGGGVRNRTFKNNRNHWNRNQYRRNNIHQRLNFQRNSNNHSNNQRSNQNDQERAHSPKYEVLVPSVSPNKSNQQPQTTSIDCPHHHPQMFSNGDNGTLPTIQLPPKSGVDLMMPSNDCTNLQALSNVIASKMTNLPLMTGVNKIFESIDAVQKNFMKKYDMSVQKEICKIQGREMLYKCGGVESVVSFDGPGIDCVTKLHTTDVSMNQRFS